MARKNVAKIPFAKFTKIAEKLNMVQVSKKGWTKFYAPGTDAEHTVRKACLAVPNTKSVTIVEVVNFEAPLAIPHPKPSAKTVTGQINFDQSPVMVLSNVYKTCQAINLAALEAAAVPEATPEVVEVVTEAPAEQPAIEAEVAVG